MSYSLAFVFLLGGIGLTALGLYFYKKMKEEEKKSQRKK